MLLNVLRIESNKMFKRKLVWIELAIIALLIFLNILPAIQASSPLKFAQQNGYAWPEGVVNSFGAGPLNALLVIVLVGVMTAQEYSWRTMQQWLSHGISRPLLLVSKLFLLIATTLLFVLAFVIMNIGLTAFFTVAVGGGVNINDINFGQVVLATLRVFYTVLPFFSLTFMLAIVFRSTVVAVGAPLIISTVENIARGILTPLGQKYVHVLDFLPNGLSQSLSYQDVSVLQRHAVIPTPPVSPLLASVMIGLYTLVFLAIAVWSFSRQNMGN